MRSLKLNIFFSCLLLIGSCPLAAQVKFTAKFTPTTIGTEETAELKLLVENAGTVQSIKPPSLKDFIVVSGPNQESGMESINGDTRQYTGITYIVKPKSKGSFVVPSTTAMADGKAFSSNPVKLTVVPGTTGNSISSNSPFAGIMNFDEPVQRGAFNDYILKKGENVADKINKNIFVKVDASKTSCYVGEPILVTYKLYTRLKSESNIVKNPSFNGFSVIDMMRSINAYSLVEHYEGRDYNVYTLRKAQLYPLQPGDVTLETASVENDIHFVKEEYLRSNNGFFNDPSLMPVPADALVDEKVTLQSKPLVISVKPLPEQGKPATFHGAVGDFKITTAVERDSISTDDAGKLKLVIEGRGNLTLVNAPELSWPAGVEAYEPSMQEEIDKQSVPLSGGKIFTFDFTVDKEGVYTLPPASFSFFDPDSGQYRTVHAEPIKIIVSKGTGKRPTMQAKQPLKSTREGFFETIFTKRWIIIIALVALLLVGLIVYLRLDRKHKQVAQVQEQAKEQEEEMPRPMIKETRVPLVLSRALLQTNDTAAFYDTLDRELKFFLAEKLNLDAGTINRRKISEALAEKNISAEDNEAVLNLMDEISLQLYTPVADESRIPYYFKKAEAVVHLLSAV